MEIQDEIQLVAAKWAKNNLFDMISRGYGVSVKDIITYQEVDEAIKRYNHFKHNSANSSQANINVENDSNLAEITISDYNEAKDVLKRIDEIRFKEFRGQLSEVDAKELEKLWAAVAVYQQMYPDVWKQLLDEDQVGLANKGCDADLIGQTVHEMMKILFNAGLKPSEQNRVLNNLRARMVGEWSELGRASEKERLEKEKEENLLRAFIQKQQPVEIR